MSASTSAPLSGSTSAFQPLETVEQLLAAARHQGLELAADTARLDTMGLDFLAVHACDAAGTRWIVRSPRRVDVVTSAQTEARILALVRRTFPFAAPDWRIHAADVIAYPRLDGTPAITLDTGAPVWNVIDPAAPSAVFIEDMARAFVALQAIAPADAEAAGVPVRTIADERAQIAAALTATREALAPPDAMWERWHRWLADDPMWPTHVALSHGDLHPGHMLLADDGHVVGILDWTEGKVTDPAIDFAMFHMCFGQAPLEQLVAAFERAGGRTWPRMIEHAIERCSVFPVLGAEWALRTGNDEVLEQVRAQLAAQTV